MKTALSARCRHCGVSNHLFMVDRELRHGTPFTDAEREMVLDHADDSCVGCGYSLWGATIEADILSDG